MLLPRRAAAAAAAAAYRPRRACCPCSGGAGIGRGEAPGAGHGAGARPVFVVGCDEAGVGALAGPIVAAAVAVDTRAVAALAGVADSKRLTAARRRELFERLVSDERVVLGLGVATSGEVDEMNPLRARMWAMKTAIEALPLPSIEVAECVVDGDRVPESLDPRVRARAVVKADATVPAVSAASVVAKVTRDAIMVESAAAHPNFSFDRHKGYPTRLHAEELGRFGPCEIHRLSYRPVRESRAARGAQT